MPFADSDNVTAWNTGWVEPAGVPKLDTIFLDKMARNQVLLANVSEGLSSAVIHSHAANSDRFQDIAVAATTNLQTPLTLDSDDDRRTGHTPGFVTTITPAPDKLSQVIQSGKFDRNNNTQRLKICMTCLFLTDCNESLSLRARLGQPLIQDLYVNPYGESAQLAMGVATPINIAVPSNGAGAIIQTDPDPFQQTGDGYFLYSPKANRTMGSYQGIVSTPGHNARAYIQFENLPLPTPRLSGPKAVLLPQGEVKVAAAAVVARHPRRMARTVRPTPMRQEVAPIAGSTAP